MINEPPFPIPVGFTPWGGLNTTDAATQLEPSELADSLNFFWNNKSARVRSAWQTSNVVSGLVTTPDSIMALISFQAGGLNQNLLIPFTDQARIYKINLVTGVATEITGPGYGGAFSTDIFFYPTIKPAVVNGNVLIPGAATKLIRHVPGAAAYTVISSVVPAFITSHLSRAVGAYDIVAANGQIKVMWSVPGDETDWTSALLGAGSTTLSEIPDRITGIGVLHDVLFVPRRYGIHLGYNTGVATTPYRFENYLKGGLGEVGNYIPASLAISNNIAYFIGPDNVYKFDLSGGLQPIGDKIVSSLMTDVINSTRQYKGVIWRVGGSSASGTATKPRPRYALVPLEVAPTGNAMIYMYDIIDGTWSKHDFPGTGAHSAAIMNFADDNTTVGTAVAPLVLADKASSNTPAYRFLKDDVSGPESTATFLLSKVFQVGHAGKDYVLRRVLVRSKDIAGNASITLTATCRLGSTAQTISKTKVCNVNHDDAWISTWFDIQLTGQNFQFKAALTSANDLAEIDYVEAEFSESGVKRG